MSKTAIVTGGARGIGQAIAAALASQGFNIVVADIVAEADKTLELCKKEGVKTRFVRCDVSCKEDRSALVENTIKEFERIDFLVNNAGVSVNERKDLLETDEESYDRVMNVNLKGPFFLTQFVAKEMLEQVREHPERTPMIVNIASLTSYASAISMGEYCLSKTGVSMMTKLFADRLAADGIFVYEIRPGIVRTEMTLKVREKYDQFIGEGGLPIPRWGFPEDIARAVAGLAAGHFLYSTGQVINVDGGFHLRRL
ncbi:MAG: 3-ketoacyl-ACP reductase [Balneolaceae bacterium]|nr:3-ketoacyl-ACP reductase [Balneolaceae bacterium]